MKSYKLFISLLVFNVSILFSQSPGTIKWSFHANGSIVSSPAIGLDSTIYFASSDCTLNAINPDGTLKWQFKANSWIYTSPAISADGTILLGTYQGKVNAINPDGTSKWEFYAGIEGTISELAIAPTGSIYVIGYDKLYKLNPDGTQSWNLVIPYDSSTPTLSIDGTLYIVSPKYGLIAINSAGEIQWRLKPDNFIIQKSPVIDADGTVFICSEWELHAVNPDGTIKWTASTESNSSSPSLGNDGTIYLGSNSYQHMGQLFAFNPNGNQKWSIDFDNTYSSPAIGSDSTLYILTGNDSFYAVDYHGNIIWSVYINSDYSNYSSPAIGLDGTVYVGASDSCLYAIYSGSQGLDDSIWPKYRANNQNQASVINEHCPQAKISESFISLSNGGQVLLDGSSSYDPDGDALSFLWRIAEKPPESTIYLTDSTSAIINVNIPQGIRESYRFALTVTDNKDGYSSASVEVSTQKKWEYQIDGQYLSSPAIDSNKSIYIGSLSGKLSAINLDGSLKWEYQMNGPVSDPVIGSEGTIYVTVVDYSYWGFTTSSLYAVNPDGTLKWNIQNNGFTSTPALGNNGTIYFGVGHPDSNFYAINPDGSIKWTLDIELGQWWRMTQASISSDGTIYVGTTTGWNYESGKLYAITDNGSLKWQIDTKGIYYAPAIDSDGTIYTVGQHNVNHYPGGGTDLSFYSINPLGYINWEYIVDRFHAGSGTSSAPVINTDGTINVVLDKLYSFNADSSIVWESDSIMGLYFSKVATIGEIGNIFIGASFGDQNSIYTIDINGNKIQEMKVHGNVVTAPAITNDGIVYFSTDEGKLYAMYSESNGLADSPWPKYMHDNRNTGNSSTPIVSVKYDKEIIPAKYSFSPLYPNPFNPVTHIKFSLPKSGKVEINVYNVLGQMVAKLMNDNKKAGEYELAWDATNLASGMYFVQFKTDDFVKVRKCLLMK